MDQMSNLKSGHTGGSVEQQALSMIDKVVDQAVELVIQYFPDKGSKTDETKLRIKSAINREIHRLAAEGQQM